MSRPALPPVATPILWHDLECGGYTADLPLWERLARRAGGPILDIGCGTGRVALHLARLAFELVAVDQEPLFIEELNRRATAEGLTIEAILGEAGKLDLRRRFPLVLAPMQLLNLLPGTEERGGCLQAIAAHLEGGGRAALTIIDEDDLLAAAEENPPILPDIREVDGWVYSSLPVPVPGPGPGICFRRLRQTISPDGVLSEEVEEVVLHDLSADSLESEATDCGLRPIERLTIPATPDHVGSTVVVLGVR